MSVLSEIWKVKEQEERIVALQVALACAVDAPSDKAKVAHAFRLLVREVRFDLDARDMPSRQQDAASIFGEAPSNLSAMVHGKNRGTASRLMFCYARWFNHLGCALPVPPTSEP